MKALPRVSEECNYKPVDTKTLNVALWLIANLPENRVLPKVATDEDGSVLFMWSGPNRRIDWDFRLTERS